MKFRWTPDYRISIEIDLEVHIEYNDTWPLIAFIEWVPSEKHFVCRFMGLRNGEFPDGKTYKTERGAKAFCERHLPVMWIHHNAKERS